MTVELYDYFITDNNFGTVTEMNHVLEFQFMEKRNNSCGIKKISKTHYVDLNTGEIKEFQLSDVRSDNKNSLKQTFKKLGYRITNNFVGAKNELMITLTFKERQQDLETVSRAYFNFQKRFMRMYKHLGKIRILSVKEPQADGTWHYHVLVKFLDQKKVTILNKFDYSGIEKIDDEYSWEQILQAKVNAPLFDIWGHGFITIRRLKNVDNIGAYLTAYMSDLPLDDLKINYSIDHNANVVFEEMDSLNKKIQKDNLNEFVKGSDGIKVTKSDSSKAVIKGGRLSLYPTNTRLFNCVNCEEPVRKTMTYKQFKNKYGVKMSHLAFRKSIRVFDDENDFSNIIVKEQFNKRISNEMISNKLYMREIIKNCLEKDNFTDRYLFELENEYYLRKMEREQFFQADIA